MIQKFSLVLSFLAIAFFIAPYAAQAQKVDRGYAKAMPDIKFMPKAEFEMKTTAHEDVPLDEEALSYRIRYPKGWEKYDVAAESELSLSTKIFSELVRFYSPPTIVGRRHRLTVEAIQLDYKLTAEQWLLQHFLSTGYTVEGFHVYSESRAEALTVKIERDVSYLVRTLVEINGSQVVLVQYYLPVENYADDKILQAQVINSFSLVNRDEQQSVEEMLQYDFLDIAHIKYPSSWKLRSSPLRSVDYMEASLLNVPSTGEGGFDENATLDGRISVQLFSAYSTESLDEAIKSFEEKQKLSGVELEDEVENHQYIEFNEAYEFARVRVKSAREKGAKEAEYEMWTAMMSSEDYFYFVTLLTPSKDEDFFLWSRNTETYKLVLENVTPKIDSITAQ